MDEPDLTTMGGRVDYVLQKSGHTPASAAAILDCSRPAIDQWILGSTKNIKNELLFKLSDLTGYAARWIATGEGPRLLPDRRKRHAFEVIEALQPETLDQVIQILDTFAKQPPIDGDPPAGTKRRAA